jgi:hypothetical protein
MGYETAYERVYETGYEICYPYGSPVPRLKSRQRSAADPLAHKQTYGLQVFPLLSMPSKNFLIIHLGTQKTPPIGMNRWERPSLHQDDDCRRWTLVWALYCCSVATAVALTERNYPQSKQT